MNHSLKPFLSTLRRHVLATPPIWLMRQAGRYLPEYRQIRQTTESFLKCCYTPAIASEITLQPLRRFDLDAAIIFSDILVIPDALGVKVSFEEKLGPQIEILSNEIALKKLTWNITKLNPIYEAIELTAKALPKNVALIGFAGAPWTLAAYMLEGKSSEQFVKARTWAYQYPSGFKELLGVLEEKIVEHLELQIKAGCEAVQIFDSWAGVLNANEIYHWSIAPLKRIRARLKERYPHLPVIIFPRGAGVHYKRYMTECGAEAISIDQHTNLLDFAKQSDCVLQGNLDPLLLASFLPSALQNTESILEGMKGKAFIFNLGHGVLPFTPPEHVQTLIERVKRAYA